MNFNLIDLNNLDFTESELELGENSNLDYLRPMASSHDASNEPTGELLTSAVFDTHKTYFITVAFPTRHKFQMKHKEYTTRGHRIIFTPVRYEETTPEEQYMWIQWILNRYLKSECEYYDIFFELTQSGNIHFHGRLIFYEKKTLKEIKLIFHRFFNLSMKYKNFVDVKVYDPKLWSDYQNKTSERKKHQTTHYKNYTNL